MFTILTLITCSAHDTFDRSLCGLVYLVFINWVNSNNGNDYLVVNYVVYLLYLLSDSIISSINGSSIKQLLLLLHY